ncbi:MAG: hypothetical protein Q9163_000052 [Psora crenata]
MDPRHGTQGYAAAGGQQTGGATFAYNSNHNDPFNSFINTEDEGAFDNTWQPSDFPSHHQSSSAFDQGGQSWQQNPYQTSESTFLAMPTFNIDPRYGAGGDSGLQFSSFNSNPVQDFTSRESLATSAYHSTSDYNRGPLGSDSQFQYSGPQELQQASQTISPQAIESYPNYPQAPFGDNRHLARGLPVAPGEFIHGGIRSGDDIAPLTHQDWRQLATRTVKSLDLPGWHIKPTGQFANTTNSKRFDGFIFVGNGSIALNCSKGRQLIIAGKVLFPCVLISEQRQYRGTKERNQEMKPCAFSKSVSGRQILPNVLFTIATEKGNDPWHPDREHLVKKLKIAGKKQAGPRPAISTQSRSTYSSESSESESDDSSEYYSDSEPEKEPDEPSPLPAMRPADPNKAVEYDLIKSVWAKRSTNLSGTVIRTALGECWDIFKGIRDKWKSKANSLQQAIEKKDHGSEKAFERRVTEQRRLLESCINLTLRHGHPSIVEKSPNIDTSLLEKTKMDKPLVRIQKRGDDQGKTLAQAILQNAKAAGEKPTSTPRANSTAKNSAPDALKIPNINHSKKERQSDSKKSPSETSKAANSAFPVKAASASGDSKASAKAYLSEAVAMKTKVINVAAKPSGFFSSLKSASKKPGTSTKAEDANSGAAAEKKPDASALVSKPAFSFAATMADLVKQKEAAPPKSEDSHKPETDEEKQKRLRKEQRRSLRVSFKGDDELVSIRTFVHDPDEELGHEDSQVRDVGDSKGEGQMLKMHKELELDEEEEYEPPEEIQISPPWLPLQPTDFSVIEDTELARNYTSRGGQIEIVSPERDILAKREKSTLMAIYTSPSDIPSSPREPAEPYVGERIVEHSFGLPDVLTKNREAEYQARQNAQPQPTATPTPDISTLLQIINNQKHQPAIHPHSSQPQSESPSSSPLAAIFAKFSTNNQQAPSPQTAPRQQPADPYNLQAALASMQLPQQQSYPPQPAYGTPQSNPAPNLQAILSQFGNQAAPPQATSMQGYGYNINSNPYHIDNDRKRQLEDEDEFERGKGKKARALGKPFLNREVLDHAGDFGM